MSRSRVAWLLLLGSAPLACEQIIGLGASPQIAGSDAGADATPTPDTGTDAGADADGSADRGADGADADASGGADGGADADASGGADADAAPVYDGCAPPPASIVSWWTGDDVFTDRIGTNNGTQQTLVPFAAGEVADAFHLTGGNYITIPDSPALDATGLSAQVTIESWVWLDWPEAGPAYGRVVDHITPNGSDGYLLDIVGNFARFIFANGRITGQTLIPMQQWTHIAGTNDGVHLNVYVNGQADAPESSGSGYYTNSNGYPVLIGADQTGGSNFQGKIDEVTYYDKALTSAQILAIYQAGSHGKCKQ